MQRLVFVFLFLLLCPGLAHASAKEGELSLGVGGDLTRLGAEGQLLKNVSDFWAFGVSVRGHTRFSSASSGDLSATADARVVIDALTWIPSLIAGVGLGSVTDPIVNSKNHDQSVNLVGRLEASLAYRPTRKRGIDLRAGVEQLGSKTAGIAGIHVIWYWGSGVGVDL